MSIHASTRIIFEMAMFQMIDKVKSGEDYSKDLELLLNAYNSASESNEKLLERIKE